MQLSVQEFNNLVSWPCEISMYPVTYYIVIFTLLFLLMYGNVYALFFLFCGFSDGCMTITGKPFKFTIISLRC